MKVSVFDTYVQKADGSLMHFDIIVPIGTDAERVYQYGREYLGQKGQKGELTAQQCQFCHVEQLQPHMEADIRHKGYFVYEMQGCG